MPVYCGITSLSSAAASTESSCRLTFPSCSRVGQVCTFLRWIKGFKIPSSAAFGKIGQAYVKAIHRFAEEHKIPVVYFKKGYRPDCCKNTT